MDTRFPYFQCENVIKRTRTDKGQLAMSTFSPGTIVPCSSAVRCVVIPTPHSAVSLKYFPPPLLSPGFPAHRGIEGGNAALPRDFLVSIHAAVLRACRVAREQCRRAKKKCPCGKEPRVKGLRRMSFKIGRQSFLKMGRWRLLEYVACGFFRN